MIEEPVENLSDSLTKPELRRGPDHQFLGETRQMHGADAGGRKGFEDEIPVRDGIERIGRRPVEAERFGRHVAVDRIGRAGQRRRAERAFVEPFARIGEPAGIAPEHFDIGQKMMAEADRLGVLQMGEAGQDRVRLLLGPRDEHLLQRRDLIEKRVDGVAHIELEIGRDLVVARAGRVQPPGRLRR